MADIGGTHIRLAQCRGETLLAIAKYRCADFTGLPAAINHYLCCHCITAIDQACLAVAAPTGGAEIKLTNNHWHFSIAAIREQFGLSRLEVINDFEAVAHGIPYLATDDLLKIGGGQPVPKGNIAVLGPGTGLGVKHLTATGEGWKVLAGEGGHVDFAPVDQGDLQLWQYLHKAGQPVAVEDILSGRGLVTIYRCLLARNKQPMDSIEPATIVQQGLSGACDHCAETIRRFMRILGTFAGNLALTLHTTGGVYLHGGIVCRLRDPGLTGIFRQRFEARGRFRFYVADIPVFLVTRQEPGLLGAARYLTKH